MAPNLNRSVLISTLLVTAVAAMSPVRASAADAGLTDTTFPALPTFAGLVNNGQEAQLRGVYVPNILADFVVQQPANQANFVSPRDGFITQFMAATSVGSTGLLAHNFLAGSKFPEMQIGQVVYLIYGNGRITKFVVTQVHEYQALQPESPYSTFVDLNDNRQMSSGQVFNAAYGRPGAVVFQTCIARDGEASWGRLFITAQPYMAPRNIR